MPPHKVRQKGIARTFQSGRLFADLSVLDNLEVTGVGLGLARRVAAKKADEMLEWIGISHLAERTGGRSSLYGRTPRRHRPRPDAGAELPAAGRARRRHVRGGGERTRQLIRRIIAEVKCGVLLIEHNIGLVLNICDHIHVLDSGEIIEVGPPAAIKASEKVRHAYMGTQADAEGAVL